MIRLVVKFPLAETRYKISRHFANKIKSKVGVRDWVVSHEFYPLSEENQRKMEEFNNSEFLQRLILIQKYFDSFHKLLVNDDNCQSLIKKKLEASFYSGDIQALFEKMIGFDRLVSSVLQIFLDFDFKLLIEDILSIETQHSFDSSLLFITDFSNIEDMISNNPFYNWSRLIKRMEELNEDRQQQYVDFEEKRELSSLIHEIKRLVSQVYSEMTGEKLIDRLRTELDIKERNLPFVLDTLYEHGDRDILNLRFFIGLEGIILGQSGNKCLDGHDEEKRDIETVWSHSLKYDLSTENNRDIYGYLFERFDTLKDSHLETLLIPTIILTYLYLPVYYLRKKTISILLFLSLEKMIISLKMFLKN